MAPRLLPALLSAVVVTLTTSVLASAFAAGPGGVSHFGLPSGSTRSPPASVAETGPRERTQVAVTPAVTPPYSFFSAMEFDTANGNVYVANWDSSNVTVIDGATGSIVANVTVGSNPDALAIDGTAGEVYVANSGSSNVSVISGSSNTVVATIGVGRAPVALSWDGANGDVYVANSDSGNVSVIDAATNKVVDSISVVDFSDESLAVDSENGAVYVGNFGSYLVYLINGTTNTLSTTIPTSGGGPWSLASDPVNGEVYAPKNSSSLDQVAVINESTNKVIANVTVGADPRPLAVDPANDEVYVANMGSDNVSVISGATNTVVATVSVGSGPIAVVVDNTAGLVYVANQGSDNVTVINASTNVAERTVSTGSEPSAIAVDSATGRAYVSNYGSSNVTTIAAGQNHVVSFNETGLPHGKTWTVVFDGVVGVGSATLSSRAFRVASEGTYSYLVSGPRGYRVSGLAPSGVILVNGANVTETFEFVKQATVTLSFSEMGLPRGQPWCVEIGGWQTCSTSRADRYANLTPGDYPYAVVSPISGQTITARDDGLSQSTTGTFTLSGSTTLRLKFVYTYPVTFTESGPYSGTWAVSTKGMTLSNATGNPITLRLPNGTFRYKVSAESGFTSTGAPARVTVDGGAASVVVVFRAKSSETPVFVRFIPSGLGLASLSTVVGPLRWRRSCASVRLPKFAYNPTGADSFPGTPRPR